MQPKPSVQFVSLAPLVATEPTKLVDRNIITNNGLTLECPTIDKLHVEQADIIVAVSLARKLEKVALACGDCHIALTGGTLYKDGSRKDMDFIVYRVRQFETLDKERFLSYARSVGVKELADFGFCVKCHYTADDGKLYSVDLLFPETPNSVRNPDGSY